MNEIATKTDKIISALYGYPEKIAVLVDIIEAIYFFSILFHGVLSLYFVYKLFT